MRRTFFHVRFFFVTFLFLFMSIIILFLDKKTKQSFPFASSIWIELVFWLFLFSVLVPMSIEDRCSFCWTLFDRNYPLCPNIETSSNRIDLLCTDTILLLTLLFIGAISLFLVFFWLIFRWIQTKRDDDTRYIIDGLFVMKSEKYWKCFRIKTKEQSMFHCRSWSLTNSEFFFSDIIVFGSNDS